MEKAVFMCLQLDGCSVCSPRGMERGVTAVAVCCHGVVSQQTATFLHRRGLVSM